MNSSCGSTHHHRLNREVRGCHSTDWCDKSTMDGFMYAQKRHAGWHTSRRLVWLHNNLRFFLSKLCWLGVRKVLFLWDVYSHHGDRLLSTWLRMEIITHSGPVTLLVGSDGGERDRPSKVPLRYRSTRCFSWLPSIPVYICGTEWAKSKTQASCRPLQWLNTRMIEDDKSHVSTGSKDYRYPPNINILKTNPAGIIHSPYWRPEQVIQGRCGRQQGTNPSQIFLVHALRYFFANLA